MNSLIVPLKLNVLSSHFSQMVTTQQTETIQNCSEKNYEQECGRENREKCNLITKNVGGNPYLRILSTDTRTAQKCIQEVKTCRRFNQFRSSGCIRNYQKRTPTREHINSVTGITGVNAYFMVITLFHTSMVSLSSRYTEISTGQKRTQHHCYHVDD